ncbi:hypothetical protein HYV22_00220 [Candidatus Gottesmanbacteria bacterium]|nr:hypothetical protein [Candidatus Gottesmanbacteria bacterium]
MSESQSQAAEVAIGEWDWVDPYTNPQAQALTGNDLIEAFRRTAKILDGIGFECSMGGALQWDVKNEELYWGLVWLKKRADELGVTLTGDIAYKDLSPEEKFVYGIFDPMKTPWVLELLETNT